MKDSTIIEVLTHLRKHGIAASNGNFNFDPKQVVEYLKNEDAFMAKQYGVAIEVYILWRTNTEILCSGKRTNGKSCRNVILNRSMHLQPKDYQKMFGRYCHVHDKR